MPIITAITPQKNNRDIYNIYIDDKFLCGLSSIEISSNDLRVNKKITSNLINSILETSGGDKAYNLSLRYLSFRPRSVYEMRQYLIRKKIAKKHIDESIEKLLKTKLLDDEKFCDSWINSRDLVKPTSKKILFLELVAKGIDKNIIEKILNQRSDDIEINNIKLIIQKKISLGADRDKVIKFLLRRGYRYSDIKKALSLTAANGNQPESNSYENY